MKNYYYNLLSNYEEKEAYRIIYNALYSSQNECIILNVSLERAKKITEYVLYSFHDLIMLDENFILMARAENKISMSFNYINFNNNLYEKKINELESSVEKKINNNSSQYLILKTIYEKLTNEIKYSHDAYSRYCQLQNLNASEHEYGNFSAAHGNAFTAYGAIVDKRAVCSGISKAFAIICEYFNIKCTCVPAVIKENPSVNHIMNVVEIDGEKYYVDVTLGLKDETLNVINYAFFLMPQAIADKIYNFSIKFDCHSFKNNYFIVNKNFFSTVVDLRRYLQGYKYFSTQGVVRFYYNGTENDCKIRKLLTDIIQLHCRDGLDLELAYVSHGFGIGIIK